MHTRRILLFLTAILATTFIAIPARADDAVVDRVKDFLAKPHADRGDLDKQPFATAKLSKDDAAKVQQMLWDDHVAYIKADRQKEWDDQAIKCDGQTMKLLVKTFGDKPKDGWNLYISMHGGGGAPKELNDQQWHNQITLYQPKDSLYIAPRAPTNDWDLWHKKEIDDEFDRLIEDAIVLGDVDPNHVYIMGYSAGGDGVYQLAPRMADRWAAASMQAGHPGDASAESLRNIGFIGQVGANDGGAQGYHRNEKLTEFQGKMEALKKADPDGYASEFHLRAGKPHWMDMEDAQPALDFMAKFTRNPYPDKIVWRQNGVTHDRFYWLAMPEGTAKAKQLVIASRKGQTIDIEKVEGVKTLTILLNDTMVDLDKPVKIETDGKTLFEGIVPRTAGELDKTLSQRGDPDSVFSAAQTVQIP
jgi:hypothetical protein